MNNPAQDVSDVDIANLAQEKLGRGVHPSTVKAVLQAARELQQAQCPNCLNDGCHCAACNPYPGELQQAQVVGDDFVVVARQMHVDADAWEAASFAFGGPGTGEGEAYMDCTLWIGEVEQDDGSKLHGLHVSCNECPEEGSITLSTFPTITTPQSSAPVVGDAVVAALQNLVVAGKRLRNDVVETRGVAAMDGHDAALRDAESALTGRK